MEAASALSQSRQKLEVESNRRTPVMAGSAIYSLENKENSGRMLNILERKSTSEGTGTLKADESKDVLESSMPHKAHEPQSAGQSVRNLTKEVLKVIESIASKEKDSTYSKITSELESLVRKQPSLSRLVKVKFEPYPTKQINTSSITAITSTPISALSSIEDSLLGPLKDRYKTELCRKFMENTSCPYGKKCQFAHGYHELRPVTRHPRYRTELCREFFTHGLCTYGARCNFIHVSPEQHAEKLSSNQEMNVPDAPQQPSSHPMAGVSRDLFNRPYTPDQDSGLCLSSISPISASLSPTDCQMSFTSPEMEKNRYSTTE